jgi:nucleoside-diphosphate-sugar epimerase/1-acyl-sn-glycerol-3-phosphate acyltransferase
MSILLTGSTGFLGNGLLYLISSADYIDTYRETVFYLIIRSKKSESAHTRLEQMRSLFPTLKLELFYEDMSKIQDFETNESIKIETIINCAAAIDFNLSIQEALEQNVSNMRNIIAFAKKNKVKNFIHISTAYVNDPYNNDIKNEFINLKLITDDRKIDQVYDDIKESKLSFKEIQKVQYFPNTYTFTKCLAELFIKKEIHSYDGSNNSDRIEFKIIRPSIITVSNLVPYPGWFKGFAAYLGYYALIISSICKYSNVDNNKINVVPVDYVCQIILNSINSTSTKCQIIHHATSPYGNYDLKDAETFSQLYNLNYSVNVGPVKKCILKSCVLTKLYLYWMYTKSMSYGFKSYIKIADKIKVLYNVVYKLDSDFDYFTHHTYNFNRAILDKPKYESTTNTHDYLKLVHDSVKTKLHIFNNPSKTFLIKQLWIILKKYGLTIRNLYMMLLTFIYRIIIRKIFKSLDVQFDNSILYSKINNSKKPLVIISNHQSCLDTFILKYIFMTYPNLYIDSPYVIVTEEFSSNTGILSKILGVNRVIQISKNNFDSNVFEHIVKNKLFDKNIIIYCEGDVSRDKVIHGFKSNVYDIVKQNMDFNILPVSITYDRVPETNAFYKSIIDGISVNSVNNMMNNSNNIFYHPVIFIKNLWEFLIGKHKFSCIVYLGDIITNDAPIESVRTTIILNHAKSYNYNTHYGEYHNRDNGSSLTQYYLDNLNAVLYNYSIQTPLVKYLRTYYDLSCIGNIHSYNIHSIHKINHGANNDSIDIVKFQSCLISDLNALHRKKTDNLLLGVYSKKIFENISSDVIEEILNQ